jgi:hypothetical protein
MNKFARNKFANRIGHVWRQVRRGHADPASVSAKRISIPATAKPFGDLAWEYFFSRPVSKEIHRDIGDVDALNHSQVNLLEGLDENYAWLGQHWPDNRFITISLSFDAQREDKSCPGSKAGAVSAI